LLTRAAYVVFFVCAATRFRRRGQVDRLISVLIFASVPAVVYGLVQQIGFDPAPTTGDPATVQWPVRSSLGQHLFFGAYLVLVIPLTAARLGQLWERRDAPAAAGAGDEAPIALLAAAFAAGSFIGVLAIAHHLIAVFALLPAILGGYALLGVVVHGLPETRSMRRTLTWGYAAVLLAQILALLLTSARGPWFGFFASATLFGVLLAWWLGRSHLALTLVGVAAVAGLVVLLLNVPGGPLEPLRSLHALHRISHLSESGGNDSSARGRLLIWQGVADLMTHTPGIGGTWGGIGRDVIGYGPESLDQAFEAVFPLKLRQMTSEVYTWDRAHDIYLDTLVDVGAAGLLLLLAAVVLFFTRMRTVLVERRGPAGLLCIGMTAAIAGHMVEGVFGLETAVTLLLFWLILGLGAASISTDDEADAERPPAVRALPVTIGYWIAVALITGLVMVLPSLSNHPAILALLWLLGIGGGIGAVAWVLMPARPAPLSESRRRATVAAAPPAGARRGIVAGAVALLAVLALLSQWQFETAANAESAGFRALTHGRAQDGIAQLQSAAQIEGDRPKYREDLATIYTGLAQAQAQGAQPGLILGPDADRTIDPTVAVTLGRDQLFTLANEALQAARSAAPLDPTVYDALGTMNLQWKRPALALAAFRHAERLSLQNPKYLAEEAQALLAQGHGAAALQTARNAERLDHTYWYSHYVLALVYHGLKQPAQARREALLGLYWEPLAFPPPPQDQINRLRTLQRTG
jgi:O-antigen ligase/Flp pilus assembly protein TadD